MVRDTIKTKSKVIVQELIVEDVEYTDITVTKNSDIYVIFNSSGPLCYVNSKEEAIELQKSKKSKSPVRYAKISLKVVI